MVTLSSLYDFVLRQIIYLCYCVSHRVMTMCHSGCDCSFINVRVGDEPDFNLREKNQPGFNYSLKSDCTYSAVPV